MYYNEGGSVFRSYPKPSNERKTIMNNLYPSKPRTSQDIWNYSGTGERLACALVGKCDVMQRLAYGRLRQLIGEKNFREVLCEALEILSSARTIDNPSAWLYWFISQELD